jgi:putative restriction endonuclease
MKREERAQQLWSILVLAARNRQILTYDLVAKATGMMTPGIGDMLRPIQQYCTEKKLPALTSLIVNGQTGLPGTGFIASENVPQAQLEVFNEDWLLHKAPSATDFADAYLRAPEAK